MKEYVFVLNPLGVIHEVDKERLPDLLKRGYQLTTKAPDYRKNLNYVDFNFNTTSYNFDGYGRISAQWQKEIIPNPKSDTFVFLGPPGIHDRKLFKKQILFTMFEADRIPKEWIKPSNMADYIIVPSDFCIKIFRKSGVKTPIVKVKLGIDESGIVYPKKEPFIFGHQNALMKDYRKGWDVLYKAFINVFGNDPGVKLLLKGRNHGPNNDRAFVDEASTHQNVEIVEKDYTYPELYQLFWKRINVFVFPSRGEGFSLPPLEAMACFPYETLVSSDTKIEDVSEKDYEGDLITVETEDGKVTCSPNHPFLTDKGFIMAKNLLTMDSIYTILPTIYDKHKMEQRRIGDITQKLSTPIEKNSSFTSKKNLQRNNVQNKNIEINENKLKYFYSNEIFFNSLRDMLSRRDNRWRRDTNIQTKQKIRENRPIHVNRKYQFNIDKLVAEEVSTGKKQGNTNYAKIFRETKNTIYLLVKGLAHITAFKRITSLSLDEKRALWNFDFFYRKSTKTKIQAELLTIRNRLLNQDKTLKQTRIIKITKKYFKGKIYNLSTQDGIYIANGFIVHNSGIPTIITDAHSHTEYIKYAIPLKISGTCKASYEIHINVAPVKGLWVEPDQKDLERLLLETYKNYDKYKKRAIGNVENIKREYSTSVFIKNLVETVKHIQSKI